MGKFDLELKISNTVQCKRKVHPREYCERLNDFGRETRLFYKRLCSKLPDGMLM